jgi:NAD(P)-dependent dehydrogenase (short-subunit alcohol dehydrogenase family)
MKNIIITGTSSGFGLMAVKTLALKGHHVFATMRKTRNRNAQAARDLKNWARDNKANITVIELDVTLDASVQKAVLKIAALTDQKIDVLINNAGVGSAGFIESFSTKQVLDVYQVHVFGADRMIKAVLPYMHKNKDGLILQITSVLARLHLPFLGVYCSAKNAIDTLAEIYSYELKDSGIDISIIQPGAFPTEINSKQLAPANSAVMACYGEYPEKLMLGFRSIFSLTNKDKDPMAVVQKMMEVIDAPKGGRLLWYPVGGDAAEPFVHALNRSTIELTQISLPVLADQISQLNPV